MAVTVSYGTARIGGDAAGDFQTNTYETGDQLLPDVLGLTGGGFVSAYNNASAADGQILLNFYGADYELIGSHHQAYDTAATNAVGQPKLTQLNNGNVLVIWDENNTSEIDAGPQASIFTQQGAVVALDINLFAGNSTSFADLDASAFFQGGFVVSYQLAGNIYFRLFDVNGAQVLPHTTVTSAVGTQVDTQVTVLWDNAFVVTWTDTNPADQAVKARIFESNGTARTAEFNACLFGFGDNTHSSVAALHDDGFAVVNKSTGLNETGVTGDPGIVLSIIDATGTSVFSQTVNLPHAGDEGDPDVAVLANGFIAVTWTRPTATSDDVYCRVYDGAGVALTGEFAIANAGLGLDESASAVAALLDGRFITSWQDSTSDGDGGQIASQITELIRTVVGDGADDFYVGDILPDDLAGGAGDDTLGGQEGDDTVNGGNGHDFLDGYKGDDLIQGGLNDDSLFGGSGDDLLYAGTLADPTSSIQGDYMSADSGADTVVGASGDDTAYGGSGDDRISTGDGDDDVLAGLDDDRIAAGAGNDNCFGETGADKIKAQSGDDTLQGGDGSDTLNGGVGDDVIHADSALQHASTSGDALNGANGHDTILGASGDDVIAGLRGKDVLSGLEGDDTIDGGSLKDVITGGLGADLMTGGSEKDTFVFAELMDSVTGFEDVITDAGNQDFIDLSAIDAGISAPLDQAFVQVSAFSGAEGELVVAYHATGDYAGFTTVQGDVDGDGVGDFTIKISGDVHNFDNFVL